MAEISAKLDILVRLGGMAIGSNLSVAERAPLLARAGLGRNEIADICNTTPAAISVRLAEAKRKPRGARRTKKGK
jgi:hypothetical protein